MSRVITRLQLAHDREEFRRGRFLVGILLFDDNGTDGIDTFARLHGLKSRIVDVDVTVVTRMCVKIFGIHITATGNDIIHFEGNICHAM